MEDIKITEILFNGFEFYTAKAKIDESVRWFCRLKNTQINSGDILKTFHDGLDPQKSSCSKARK